MALKLSDRYPGRFDTPTAGYPQGSFKNRTTPTAKDGSYLEKDWANDKEGFFQRLLLQAGITPNGSVDTALSSQYYAALESLIPTLVAGQFVAKNAAAAIKGNALNLVGATTGTSAVVSSSAGEIILAGPSNTYMVARNAAVSASFLVAGLGGIDTGAANSQAVNTWWYLHMVSNGTLTGAVLSLNPTTPTMPAGYTFSAMVMPVRIDNTANRFPLGVTFEGKSFRWLVKTSSNVPSMPLLASGSVGSVTVPTWIAVAWANVAPPMTKRLVVVSSNGSGTTIVAPNNNYGASTSTTNPSPVQNSASGAQLSWIVDLILESSSIYWASNAGGAGLFAAGFEI